MIASITYSRHAEQRMRERGITRAHVEATLSRPDLTLPAHEGKLRAVRTLPNGPTITVVYAEIGQTPSGSDVQVVTVW